MQITRINIFRALMCLTLAAMLNVFGLAQEVKEYNGDDVQAEVVPAENPHALIGTWTVQSSVTNCNGTTLQNFSKLASFNQGGTAVETSTGLPASQRTTALGVWDHSGRNAFRYAVQFFRFAADGSFIGTTRAQWQVGMNQMSGSYTATASIQVVLPNGNVVATLCGLETGTRLTLPE